jgi:hypothetical protein
MNKRRKRNKEKIAEGKASFPAKIGDEQFFIEVDFGTGLEADIERYLRRQRLSILRVPVECLGGKERMMFQVSWEFAFAMDKLARTNLMNFAIWSRVRAEPAWRRGIYGEKEIKDMAAELSNTLD